MMFKVKEKLFGIFYEASSNDSHCFLKFTRGFQCFLSTVKFSDTSERFAKHFKHYNNFLGKPVALIENFKNLSYNELLINTS